MESGQSTSPQPSFPSHRVFKPNGLQLRILTGQIARYPALFWNFLTGRARDNNIDFDGSEVKSCKSPAPPAPVQFAAQPCNWEIISKCPHTKTRFATFKSLSDPPPGSKDRTTWETDPGSRNISQVQDLK